MRHALRIFRKDVRHLWPVIAVMQAVALPLGWGSSSPSPYAVNPRNVLAPLILLAFLYLIVAVMHEEAAPGNRQYWVTRPFSWRDLLAAKAIFILVFLCLPGLAGEVITLVVRGKSPVAYLPEILVSQLFSMAKVILPVAALAAITANFVEFMWMPIAGLVAFVAIVPALSLFTHADLEWGGLGWSRVTVAAILSVAASVAILLVQYARRRTWLSRGILAAALLIGTSLFWMPGWHTAFALQAWLSGQHVAGTVARIAFDPPRDPRTRPGGGSTVSLQDIRYFWIPVRVTGIPSGMALYSDRGTLTVATPSGERWSMGWNRVNRLVSVAGSWERWSEDARSLPGDGEYWLHVNIDQSLLRRTKSGPIHLHARMALTLLSPERTSPLASREGAQAVSNDGFCWVTSRGRQLETACSWPVRTPAQIGFRLRSSGTGLPRDWKPYLTGNSVGSYGPYPTSGGLWETVYGGGTVDLPPAGIDLVSRTAVAHFERDLDVPDLGEWAKR
jgi:hypothetical protein